MVKCATQPYLKLYAGARSGPAEDIFARGSIPTCLG
jgi:hypothetical protein